MKMSIARIANEIPLSRVGQIEEEIMEWMLDIQLGRRNLSPIQRIAVTEKYRPIYEKQAKKNIEEGGRKGGLITQNKPSSNLTNPLNSIDTNKKLADIAGVKPTTYKMGAKVLNSDNDELKQRVLSGETPISAGYKEPTQCKKSDNCTPVISIVYYF